MLNDFIVLAADVAAYNAALRDFQAGVSLTGVGVLVGGVAILFSKKYKIAGVVVCIAALALIVYPWLAFEPMPVP